MNKTFQWNGQKFPFSAMEAETGKKVYSRSEKKQQKELENYEKNTVGVGNLLSADDIIAECKIIDSFLNNLLGEGATEKMFQNYDLGERVLAVQKLTRLNNAQVEEYEETAGKGLFA